MNPFNQSRFRNEHTLGDSYKIVKEVHDKMDIVKMVADNISNFRSGNIELKGEGSSVLWKYTEGTEWFSLMDTIVVFTPLLQSMTTDMFTSLLQSIANIEEDIVTQSSDIAGNALAIEGINTEATALETRVTDLTSKSDTAATDIAENASDIADVNLKATALELRVADLTSKGDTDAVNIASNTSEIATINAELVDIKDSITTLTSDVSEQATTLSGIISRLDALESA